jgi:ribose/xylose/arabinose/galactoside ABC-type transport system permease subunit
MQRTPSKVQHAVAEPSAASTARVGPHPIVSKIPIVILIVAVVVVSLAVPRFLTARNIINIAFQTCGIGLMAIGLTAVLITGGIDLSVPAVMALSGILGAMAMRAGAHPALGVLIMLAAGGAIGAFNGFAVARLKMIPFVVTLATMVIATGTSVWVTNATSVGGLPAGFVDTVTARLFEIPAPVFLLFVVVVVAQVLITRSIYGRWLYAVGKNVKTARVSGVPADAVIFGAYIVSGLMAGLAAVVLVARLESAAAAMGRESVVLDIISSAVVGGVSIYGGVGTPLGAVLGALFITSITNSMNMLGVSYFTTLLIKGSIIIIAVGIDSLRRR